MEETDRPHVCVRAADIDQLPTLRSAFTEPDLPFRVDLIDMTATDPDFCRIIERDHSLLNRCALRRAALPSATLMLPSDGATDREAEAGRESARDCHRPFAACHGQ